MVQLNKLFNGTSRDGANEEEETNLLPINENQNTPDIPPREVTKIALRLKHQIETVVPCELEEDTVTTPLSPVITPEVVDTAGEAGGKEYKACVVFCLLICHKWFTRLATLELWDADLHQVRAVACEIIAKRIIEAEEDVDYLHQQVLLKRFAIFSSHGYSSPTNVIERAADQHSLTVIGSSGYQKCVSYLWRGWLVQDEDDPTRFVAYKHKINTDYWVHLDPDRMRVPRYQNALQVTFSIVFLALYTGAINTINPGGDLDPVETLLYLFTLGFVCDEIAKLWKVGRFYIAFWNIFNSLLYALLVVSFVTRMVALSNERDHHERIHWNEISYSFLAFTAPMFWMRLMLYLDMFRFFGAMLVIVKIMMKESIIFFALLFFVLVGFFQAFIGLDQVDSEVTETKEIVQAMINAVMDSPEYGNFDIAPPFGTVLYYIFTFAIMVILLNILIALFGSAYESITANSTDEYMALFTTKCLQFVRAPDDNVYIAPLNLVELFGLVLPFEWWLEKHTYEKLNDYVMAILYAPLLFFTAFLEQQDAKKIRTRRRRGEEDDDDTIEEWEELGWTPEGREGSGAAEHIQPDGGDGAGDVLSANDMQPVEGDKIWCEKVKKTSPNVKANKTVEEVQKLQKEVKGLKDLVEKFVEGKKDDGGEEGSKKDD